MNIYIKKMMRLMLWFVCPALFLSYSNSIAMTTTITDFKHYRLERTIASIKKNINDNPTYQSELGKTNAELLFKQLDSIVDDVNNHKISENDALTIVNYEFFKFRAGHFPYEFQNQEPPPKRNIPKKPGPY